jgi:hypothetical protein
LALEGTEASIFTEENIERILHFLFSFVAKARHTSPRCLRVRFARVCACACACGVLFCSTAVVLEQEDDTLEFDDERNGVLPSQVSAILQVFIVNNPENVPPPSHTSFILFLPQALTSARVVRACVVCRAVCRVA